jgi:hypothetical protein
LIIIIVAAVAVVLVALCVALFYFRHKAAKGEQENFKAQQEIFATIPLGSAGRDVDDDEEIVAELEEELSSSSESF